MGRRCHLYRQHRHHWPRFSLVLVLILLARLRGNNPLLGAISLFLHFALHILRLTLLILAQLQLLLLLIGLHLRLHPLLARVIARFIGIIGAVERVRLAGEWLLSGSPN